MDLIKVTIKDPTKIKKSITTVWAKKIGLLHLISCL